MNCASSLRSSRRPNGNNGRMGCSSQSSTVGSLRAPRASKLPLASALCACVAGVLVAATRCVALAQETAVPGEPHAQAAAGPTASLWGLFIQSVDLFTVVLLVCSVTAVTVMIRAGLEITSRRIVPAGSVKRLSELLISGKLAEAETYARRDDSMPSRVLSAAMSQRSHGESAMRDAAELAVSDEVTRWLQRIEPLNVIGNLGPLIGLAGTVWGMILAFNSLGITGGQAGPAALSLGISKALFHTLLGLCVAIPCLAFFGVYRGRVDRICSRGMTIAQRQLERLLEAMTAAVAPANGSNGVNGAATPAAAESERAASPSDRTGPADAGAAITPQPSS